MPFKPGQSGNPNGAPARPKLWDQALRLAVKSGDGRRLRQAAESLLDQAAAGEAWAIKELADRLDGKAPQAITGDGGAPFIVRVQKLTDIATGEPESASPVVVRVPEPAASTKRGAKKA